VRAEDLLVTEVLAVYLKEHAPTVINQKFLHNTAGRLIPKWWTGKTLTEVTNANCRAYTAWRREQLKKTGEPVSDQTIRHELTAIQSAMNWYKDEKAKQLIVPDVWRPPATPPREDYFLTRSEVAGRIRIARNLGLHHLARFLLIGTYSGNRPDVTLKLSWLPSAHTAWVDLDNLTLHRKDMKERDTKKRRPRCRIHNRLLRLLRRWRAADMAMGITSVIHYRGKPIETIYSAWRTVAALAGKPASMAHDEHAHDAPHILRHTACTLLIVSNVELNAAAAYVGMTPELLWRRYGHHHPSFQAAAASFTGKVRGL
jgi:hypothetical protein